MAIPRRLIVLAVSAAAAGAVFYISSKMKKQGERRERSPLDEANEKKEAAEKEKAKEQEAAKDSAEKSGEASPVETAEKKEPGSSTAQKELSLFLAGDAWHDEIGWQALWEKEGVPAADVWLKTKGKEVLVAERKKLTDHPALLAGCRRRWIVVCRYAGIDVGDAATLWTNIEVGV